MGHDDECRRPACTVEVVRPLSVEDLTILGLESETVAGHTCKVIMLGDGIDADRLRASIASRLDQRSAPANRSGREQGEPCWVREPNLDLDHHVVVYDQAGPLDMAGLRSAVARIFEQRLDRARPLWRIDIVPSLAGGGCALVWRIHHALADGTTAMRVAEAAVWDRSPDARAAGSLAAATKSRESAGAPPLRWRAGGGP